MKPEEKYISYLQLDFILADTQNLFGEIGRGAGKTSNILPARIDRVQNDMPGSTSLFANATFTSLYEDILPTLISYFTSLYQRGVYFEIGKKPPKHFKEPRESVHSWKNVMSFANGSTIYFTSLDRKAPSVGKNAVHLFMDELLRIPEQKVTERLYPTLRQNRAVYGDSPYFQGISGFSSTPGEFDYDWWLKYEKDMDRKKINKIKALAYRLFQLKYFIKKFNIKKQSEKDLNKLIREKVRIELTLKQFRKNNTFFGKGSSFTNTRILGLDYIIRQYDITKNFENFSTSILAIRRSKTKNKFFAKFTKKNIYDDSYKYERIERDLQNYNIDKLPAHDCRELKHLNSELPLRLMIDPGAVFSLIVAQKQPNTYRVLKNFWAITPQQHKDLVEKFDNFFKYHKTKYIILDSDRAGNKKLYINPKTGQREDTDAIIFVRELQKKGWSVKYRSATKRTIYHYEHYILLDLLFSQRANNEQILIDRNECKELISSIEHSPVKKTESGIELDKTAEKKLPYTEQIEHSPQLATALMYGLHGEYESKYPTHKNHHTDIGSHII